MLTGDQVLDTLFTQTQFRRGYDEREVDDLLDAVVETLRAHEAGRHGDARLRAADVESARLTQTQFRRGYDEREIDEFLERVVATLRHHEGGRAAPTSTVPTARATAPVAAPSEKEPFGRRVVRLLRGESR
jgi:DivIVA domain-containing protein